MNHASLREGKAPSDHIFGIVVTLAIVGLDYIVSTKLKWQGLWAILTSQDLPKGTSSATFFVLVSMGLLLYIGAGWAAAEVKQLLRLQPHKIDENGLQNIVDIVWSVLAIPPPNSPSDALQAPISAYTVLRSYLRSASRDARSILERVGPRDLLGVPEIERAFSGAVQIRWHGALVKAERVDGLGLLAALFGLAGTTASLSVGALGFGSTGISVALSAAMLKCMTGLFIRFFCVLAKEHIFNGAREEEFALMEALSTCTSNDEPVQRPSAPTPSRNPSRSRDTLQSGQTTLSPPSSNT